MERDALDFGQMQVSRLFLKLFVPTLFGLLFVSLLNLADGIFVGHGVGSDALAAINIGAPVFLLSAGVALMFGTGVSVVAAVHLSRGNVKAARICVTQAFSVSCLLMTLLAAVIMLFPRHVATLFGGTERLMPLVLDYMLWVTPGLIATTVAMVGLFVLRLDGAPRFAMMVQVGFSLLNIVLDWWMVFPLQMGLKGAAIATTLSSAVGGVLILYYMCFRSRQLHFYRPKFTRKALRLTLRNVGYMSQMGLSSMIGELAISGMMIVGNYMFVRYLGEDGVAAYSVACYLFPFIFMMGNAIAQSLLPIVSYNYGVRQWARIRLTRRLSLRVAVVSGVLLSLAGMCGSSVIAHIFLPDGQRAWQIAADGLPYFSAGFMLCTLNIVFIGYYQSVERARPATLFMLLRGFIVVVPVFVLLPSVLGDAGLWLALPVSELLTLAVIFVYDRMLMNKRKDR